MVQKNRVLKNELIQIRVTEREKKAIEQAAFQKDMTVSEFIRELYRKEK